MKNVKKNIFQEKPAARMKKTQKSEKTITFFTKIDKKSCIFSENPCAKMQKKLHPCIETLNSRNSGLIEGLVWIWNPMWWIPLRPRLVKDPMWRILLRSHLVLGPYGGLVWARTLKTWKSIGFTVFSLKIVEKHWFYSVLAPKCWKNIGFTVFSLQNVEKALVLQTKRP